MESELGWAYIDLFSSHTCIGNGAGRRPLALMG